MRYKRLVVEIIPYPMDQTRGSFKKIPEWNKGENLRLELFPLLAKYVGWIYCPVPDQMFVIYCKYVDMYLKL
jgi:hypothetical protein